MIKDKKIFANPTLHITKFEQLTFERLLSAETSKVLLLYTGGTIGMVYTEKGYVPKKNYLENFLKSLPTLCDPNYTSLNVTAPNTFITPFTVYKKRIQLTIYEFATLLDSSNMAVDDWINIASKIEENYAQYDSFIIIHGTDTMSYTASALSFMLENLSKTVIITGSQIPIYHMHSDALNNLIGAINIAGHFCIPEVCVYFNNNLYRGCRTMKLSSNEFKAFTSPNFPPLATYNSTLQIKWENIRTNNDEGSTLSVFKNMSKKFAFISLYPQISEELLQGTFSSDVKAIVIASYGAGNIPTNYEFLMNQIKKATQRGVIILNVTQCLKGDVIDAYEGGRLFVELGAVNGRDMTKECAVAKMSYLIGKYNDTAKIKSQIIKDLRGEQTDISVRYMSQQICLQTLNGMITRALEDENDDEAINILENCKSNVISTLLYAESNKILQSTKVSTVNKLNGMNVFHFAAIKNSMALLNTAITMKVDCNLLDNLKRTPLYYAIQLGNWDIVNALMKCKACLKADISEVLIYISASPITTLISYLKNDETTTNKLSNNY